MAKRYAICIGTNIYANNPNAALSYARSDAEEVAKILRDPTRGAFDRVYELLDEEATKHSIRETIDGLLQDPHRRHDDLVVVYFAGHGVRDQQADLCLVPYDFSCHPNGDLAFSSMYHAKELEISINNSRAKNIILLVDSCHSGALGRILGDIGQREGMNLFVIGAAQASESAIEYKALQHGVFTECLLRALTLVPDQGEWISLAQVVSFVSNELLKFPTSQLIETTSHFTNLNVQIARNPSYSLGSKSFTKRVQSTFELANYVVHPAPTWCNYPNLFIAEMRAGFQSAHSAVLCLDDSDKKPSVGESQIDLFLTLVGQLRNDGDVGDGILVTPSALVNQLRRGIEDTGYTKSMAHSELVRRVIDFDPYLTQLVDEFEKYDPERPDEPPLSEYYVELEGESRDEKGNKQEELAEQYIANWVSGKSRGRQLSVLGEYGTGKTTICRKLARDFAYRHLHSRDKSKHRIPILIALREFPRGQADIEIFLSGHLARRCHVNNPSFEAFKAMNDAGVLLLILDGFDEMAVNVDEDVIQANLTQIDQLASSPSSKVLLTSRPEYFLTVREESEALNPTGLLTRRSEYERLDLLPFGEEHIQAFLKKKIPFIKNATQGWRYYYDAIKRIHDLTDLSQRPVMLEMIIKTLPELLAQDVVVDRPTLYQTYLDGEIRRQVIEKRRELLIKRNDRFRMMQALAVYLYVENAQGLTAELVQILMYDEFSAKQREELEAHTRDFLTCSFLGRRGDKYAFSHRSFVEYLTAKALLEEIENDRPSKFGKQLLTQEVVDFLVELKPRPEVLLQWVHSTKYRGFETVRYLGSNAITVFQGLGENLSDMDLSGTVMRWARLSSGTLTNNVFAKCDLASANLSGAIIDGCNFEESDLTKAKLGMTHAHKASFKNAILDHTDFTKADLSHADFTNSLCYNANFEDAIVDHARLDGFSLNGVSKASSSLRLELTDLFGVWTTTEPKSTETLTLGVDPRNGELSGTLDFRQSEVIFTGTLKRGRYVLKGEELDKQDKKGRRQCSGYLSCNEANDLVVEVFSARDENERRRQGTFRRSKRR